jgi:DNA-binding transcriptional ArsR family regulator
MSSLGERRPEPAGCPSTVPSVARDRAGVDPRLVKAISHPLRFRVLVTLGEGVDSPKGVATKLGEPLGRISHHIRVLAGIGAIELVETKQRRGAVEHFYRATARVLFDDETWDALPPSVRRSIFGHNLAHILDDVRRAAAGGGFEHPRAHVSYTLLDLDEEGFDAVADLLVETVDRLLSIRSASAERLAGTDTKASRTVLGILHFEQR